MRVANPSVHATSTGNRRHDFFRHGVDAGTFPMTVFYESDCPLCNAEMTNLKLRNTQDKLVFCDVSAPEFNDFPEGASMQDLLQLIHARTADGRVLKGVEVFRLAYQAVGLDWVSTAMRLPLLRTIAEMGYPVLARNRHRIPRGLIVWMFEGASRRAARRVADAHCESGTCAR